MEIFPITKVRWDNNDEEASEIIGYQVIAPDGSIVAKAETQEEVSEAALIAMYLAESNPNPYKKEKRRSRLLRKKAAKIS